MQKKSFIDILRISKFFEAKEFRVFRIHGQLEGRGEGWKKNCRISSRHSFLPYRHADGITSRGWGHRKRFARPARHRFRGLKLNAAREKENGRRKTTREH